MYAFRFPFVAYARAGAIRFWGRTPAGGGGPVGIQVRSGGRWLGAADLRAGPDGVFHGALRSAYGRERRGAVRAVYRGEASLPFSLRPVPDFHQPPFG